MEEKYYKVYVPIEMKYRKDVRMHAAMRDMRPAEFLEVVIRDFLSAHPIEPDLPFMKTA